MSGGHDFDAFVRNEFGRLVGAAVLIVGDREEARDLVQDALVRVHGAWWRIRSPHAAHAYAYTTVMRLARRRLASRRVPTTPIVDHDPADPSHGPDTDTDRLLVDGLLPLLPVRQRQTVVLRFVVGMSTEETADTLGCSVGTVKSQTSKALERLRRELSTPDREMSEETS